MSSQWIEPLTQNCIPFRSTQRLGMLEPKPPHVSGTMQKPHKPQKNAASWQAQVAFYLSLALAAFQIFQLWHSGRETRVAASVELAKSYISDQDISRGRRLAINALQGKPFAQFTEEEAGLWNKFILNAGYVATLLEENRLDRPYLPNAMVCDIWLAGSAARKIPGKAPDQTSSVERMAPSLEKDCAHTFLAR